MEAMLGDDKRSVNIGLQDEVIKENLLGHGGHYAILSSTLLFRSVMDFLFKRLFITRTGLIALIRE